MTSKLKEAHEAATARSQALREETGRLIGEFERLGVAVLSAPAGEVVGLAVKRDGIKSALRDLLSAQEAASHEEERALAAYSRARLPEVEREIDDVLQRLRRALRESIRELRPIADAAAVLEAEARNLQYPGLSRTGRQSAVTSEAALLSAFEQALSGVESDSATVVFTKSYAPKFGPLAKRFFQQGQRAQLAPGTAALLVGEGVAEVIHA